MSFIDRMCSNKIVNMHALTNTPLHFSPLFELLTKHVPEADLRLGEVAHHGTA